MLVFQKDLNEMFWSICPFFVLKISTSVIIKKHFFALSTFYMKVVIKTYYCINYLPN